MKEKAEKSGFSKGKLERSLELVRTIMKNENITSEDAFDRLYLSKEEREEIRKLL